MIGAFVNLCMDDDQGPVFAGSWVASCVQRDLRMSQDAWGGSGGTGVGRLVRGSSSLSICGSKESLGET